MNDCKNQILNNRPENDDPERTMRRRTSAGFSLTETVVALAILSLALAGAYGVVGASIRLEKESHKNYQSVSVANNRLQQIQIVPLTQINDLAETDTRVNKHGENDLAGEFYRTTTITDPWPSNTNAILVEVRVERDIGSVRQTNSMATLLVRRQSE